MVEARRRDRTASRSCELLQGVEGAVRVHAHADLALHHLDHPAVLVDHERDPLGGPFLRATPIILRDVAVGVGQQRVVEPVLVGELVLLVDRVAADADALPADRGELGRQVAEVAALLRAPRGHRRRVEEQHHGAVRPAGRSACAACRSRRAARSRRPHLLRPCGEPYRIRCRSAAARRCCRRDRGRRATCRRPGRRSGSPGPSTTSKRPDAFTASRSTGSTTRQTWSAFSPVRGAASRSMMVCASTRTDGKASPRRHSSTRSGCEPELAAVERERAFDVGDVEHHVVEARRDAELTRHAGERPSRRRGASR